MGIILRESHLTGALTVLTGRPIINFFENSSPVETHSLGCSWCLLSYDEYMFHPRLRNGVRSRRIAVEESQTQLQRRMSFFFLMKANTAPIIRIAF